VKEFHGRRQLLPNRMPVQQQPFGSAGASPSQGGPTSTSSGMAWSANTRQLTLTACLWGGHEGGGRHELKPCHYPQIQLFVPWAFGNRPFRPESQTRAEQNETLAPMERLVLWVTTRAEAHATTNGHQFGDDAEVSVCWLDRPTEGWATGKRASRRGSVWVKGGAGQECPVCGCGRTTTAEYWRLTSARQEPRPPKGGFSRHKTHDWSLIT